MTREERNEYYRNYRKTEKGRLVTEKAETKYRTSKKCEETVAIYKKSDKRKATRKRALHSVAGVLNTKKVKLRRRYGVTLEEIEQKKKIQNNVCYICGNSEYRLNINTGKIRELSVDHNHKTGQVRDMLCSICNLTIGYAKESSDRLRKCADYLDKWNSVGKELYD